MDFIFDLLFEIFTSKVFKGFVVAPLACFGFYQLVRGIGDILEQDLAANGWMRGSRRNITWQGKLYAALTILGCVALVVAL